MIAFAMGLLVAGLSTAQGAPMRYAEDRAPAIVNPLFATTMSEARIDELVFDGLFSDDQELRSVPRLVQSFELAADQQSMTLRLRQDIAWHDGQPFDSGDVVFSINAYRDKGTASSEAGRVAWIAKAEAMSPHVVRLQFVKPEYAPQDKLHFKILPEHKFSSTTVKRSDPFRARPVGTGPFKVESFNDDNSVSMSRHMQRWDPAGIEEMVMREVSDKNYQAKLLVYESLEALIRVLPRDLATLQNDRKIELHPYQTNSWWYFGLNERRAPFGDVRVRQAIALMMDVDKLLKPIGTGDRVSGPFVTSSPFYNHDVPLLPHDPNKAATLLKSAGFKFDGENWKQPNGKPLTIKLVTLSNLEAAQDVVINVQSQLQNQGVKVEPEFLGMAEYRARIWGNQDFDMLLSQWSFDRSEDIFEQFHSRGSRNFTGFSDATTDKLLEQARGTTDPQRKKALMRQAHRQISAGQPMVFLWTLDSYAAMSTRVKSVTIHPFYFFTWASDWKLTR
ncbi:MAG: ABC transporter substrate-binding protein [Myxococcota bacterium]